MDAIPPRLITPSICNRPSKVSFGCTSVIMPVGSPPWIRFGTEISVVMLWLVSWLTRYSLHRIVVTRALAFGKRNELRKDLSRRSTELLEHDLPDRFLDSTGWRITLDVRRHLKLEAAA